MSQHTNEVEKLLETPEQLAKAELDKFVKNKGLDKLAGLFGFPELPSDPHERLLTLESIASNNWNFRNGVERHAVNWNHSQLDQEGSEQWNTIFEAAEMLGMVQNSETSIESPDLLVVLGGANRSPLNRLRYGLEHVKSFGMLVYLGSARALSDEEKAKVIDYAPYAQTEFDLGHYALENFLRAEAVGWYLVPSGDSDYQVYQYECNHNGKSFLAGSMCTPQKIGERRANTYDNYDFLAEQIDMDNANKTVVAVTNATFIPGQHLAAVQELTLKHSTKVETIGFCADYNGEVRKPSQLLQEAKAGIDAAVKLGLALSSNTIN